MRCPRDNQLLNRKMSERLFGNGCRKCDGIFLAGKKSFAYQNKIDKQLKEHTIQNFKIPESQLHCPDCNNIMRVTMVDNIEIDICAQCLGVWFDKSEAHAVIKKYNQNDDSEQSTNLIPFPSEFVHILSKWFLNKNQV